MTQRLSRGLEKPFRDALGHAVRNEFGQMRDVLMRLPDEGVVACLSLCLSVAAYVAIDACGRQWPDEDNLRRLGEATTKSDNARAFGLRAEDSYAYVKRAALRGEQLAVVFPAIEDAVTLSFVITGRLLVSFGPAELHWWEYLNKIEDALEVAAAADLDLLPALMLRARRLASPAG